MIRKQHKLFARITAILFIVFFGYVIFSADKGTLLPFIQRLYAFPYGDKVGHLFLPALVTLASNCILTGKGIFVFGRMPLIGSLTVFVLISVEEVSQIIFSTRTFDLLDLMFSYIGIVFGYISIRFLFGKKRVVSSYEAD